MSRSDDRAWPLEAFGRQVDGLTVPDLTFLRAAWDGADETVRTRAWKEVRQVVADLDRTVELQDLEERLVRWAGGEALRGVYPPYGVSGIEVRSNSQLRFDALPPLMDAGASLLLGEELSQQSADALIDPWRTLSEEPSADDAES
jgi:hypothetical protein